MQKVRNFNQNIDSCKFYWTRPKLQKICSNNHGEKMRHLRDTTLHDLPIAVLDFETTGLSANYERVVQASVVHLNRHNAPHVVFDSLVDPQKKIDPRAEAVHGISDRDVEDAPTFAELAETLLDSLEGRVIAAYNAPFDLRFLRAELGRVGLSFDTAFICVMELRQLIFAEPKCKLVDACRELNLALDQAHDSAADALATGQLLRHYFDILSMEQIHCMGELSILGRKSFLSSFKHPAFSAFTEMWIAGSQTDTTDRELLDLNEKCEKLNDSIQQEMRSLEALLVDGISDNVKIHWEKLYMPLEFPQKPPRKPEVLLPEKPDPNLRPSAEERPSPDDEQYQMDETMLDSFLPWRVAQKESEIQRQFEADLRAFKQKVQKWNHLVTSYKSQVDKAKKYHAEALKKHQQKQDEYELARRNYRQVAIEHNAKLTDEQKNYKGGHPATVAKVMTRVLMNSETPESFPNAVAVQFDSTQRCLKVFRELPPLDSMPRVKGYKVIKKKLELRESELSEAAQKRVYDSIVYQLVLRTIYEIFVGDEAGLCDCVEVLGTIDGYDPATGNPAHLIIAKCAVSKEQFRGLRLKNVDPYTCFKELGGKTKTRPSNQKPLEAIPY